MVFTPRWKQLVLGKPAASTFTLIGGVLFLIQTWIYAHSQASVLDEGAYLVKGILFATGRYWPYQDNGPWSNHMPLAFLIPGFVQQIFGLGLRTGRYFAIFIAGLMLLGLWLVVRRLAGRWWAAGVVWAVAVNPALAKMYSMAISEGLVACMLVWIMVSTLGEERSAWQISLGGLLVGVVVMTRLNLAPVLPLFIGYIFWQHGWRSGIIAGLVAGVVIIAGHVIFWPGILRTWAVWLPERLFHFLSPWRPPEGIPVWSPEVGLESRVISFFQGIRYHFLPVLAVTTALLVCPSRKIWKSQSNFRTSVYLVCLFVVLFALHAWAAVGSAPTSHAAMGKNYCVFCFPLYLSFFSTSGLVLMALFVPSISKQLSKGRQAGIVLLVLILCLGIGYSLHVQIQRDLVSTHWIRSILSIPVPRYSSFRILPGNVEVGVVLGNLLGIDFWVLIDRTQQILRKLIPTMAGLLVFLLILAAVKGVRSFFARKGETLQYSYGWILLLVFSMLGFILSPTEILGGGYHNYDCGGNVIAAYEAVGLQLATNIRENAKIYWRGGSSAVPLLYLPGVGIFPPQLNSDFSFRLGGDSDALQRYGFWNQELAERWLREADFILVEQKYFRGWLKQDLLDSTEFQLLHQTAPILTCREDTSVLVYQAINQ